MGEFLSYERAYTTESPNETPTLTSDGAIAVDYEIPGLADDKEEV